MACQDIVESVMCADENEYLLVVIIVGVVGFK